MSGIENRENGGSKDNQKNILPVFVNEQTARVPAHGSVSYRVPKQAPNRQSKLPEILDKIKDPNVSVAEVIRLIAVEMTLIVQDMRTCESDGAAAFQLKSCMGQIRALRAVAEAAKEADSWAKRDVLDFDGPKFTYALGKITTYFKKAALDALRGDESTVKSIMMHFRDIAAEHDAELRRETEKIGYRIDSPSFDPSREDKNLQRPETSARAVTTENDALDNAASHHTERSDRGEPESSPEPFKDLIESPADRALFKDVQESIQREPESDYDVAPPSDLGNKSNDVTPPETSEDEV